MSLLSKSNDGKHELESNNDPSIKFGRILTNPEPGDEVVISGLSGTYPESKDVYQFRDNLFGKLDMITGDNRRWDPGHPEIPQRSGKVPDIDKFDAGYFGIHYRQVTCMDPMIRLVLEKVIEALFDAGIHPSDLEGTNTGVFGGACVSETEKTWFYQTLVPQGNAITGCIRSMIAHRISYFLKLKGRSFVCDTACSSSLFAFEHAYRAIRTGQCNMAIVVGTNLCLHPFVTLQFARLGVLSMDGACKVFDDAGNGYARSEATSVIILQKSKNAKRIYSTILHAKTNCDGFKNSGITFPSKDMQIQLATEIYEECTSIKSSDISYLEAHGTGTKVGDPEELHAIENVYLKGRVTPLPIGSVKSNIGHCEPSSGICAITKAIIAFETGYIPPNLRYNTPRAGIKSLTDGQLTVVTEKMPFQDDHGLIGINNFGFGGANCHVILKHHLKQKANQSRPQEIMPRLVCVSGRSKEAVDVLLDDVIENHVDVEHIRLLHDVFRKNVVGHHYRGYSLVAKSGEISRSWNLNVEKIPLIICFGEIDENITNAAMEYLKLPLAIKILQRINEVIGSKSHNISEILSKTQNQTILEKILARFTIQMIFADIFKAIDIVPSRILGLTQGLSLGTLVCAYFDGAINLREAFECAYLIATAVDLLGSNVNSNELSVSDLVKNSGQVALQLQKALKEILVKPRKFSKKVICEVTPTDMSSIYLSNCFDSTEVLTYLEPVIRKNFVIFEVGNGHINELLEKDLDHLNKKVFISTKKGDLNELLVTFGRLYELGHNPQIQELFPKVEFPVSRGTPMISPKIKWNHSRKWWVTQYRYENQMRGGEKDFIFDLRTPEFTFLSGHIIDGRTLFPATGYLHLVWDTFANVLSLDIVDLNVMFENCRFKRACHVPKEGNKLQLIVMIQRASGNFEVIEGGVSVVTGRITRFIENNSDFSSIPLPTKESHAQSMTSKDIYKELKLRGYNYKDQFRGIRSCDLSAQVGEIVWDGNWVTFMDNMLQLKILQEDARFLYVPTTIRRLTINAKEHIKYLQAFEKEQPNLPVYVSRDTGIIRSGFIEIRGLNASSIPRRKYLGTPVLEKYVFVPNVAKIQSKEAIRVNMQIILENLYSINVKAVELIDDDAPEELQSLGELVNEVLADQPLIQSNVIVCKGEESKKSLTEVDCSLVIGSFILNRKEDLKFVFGLIKENGFILSREPIDFDVTSCSNQEITVVTEFTTDQEKLILFRKNRELSIPTVINVLLEDKQFTWLPKVQRAVEKDGAVLVYAHGEPLSGALGFIACLRREPGGHNVKLVFVPDSSTPEFDLTLPFYQDQLRKNLAINVYKNGEWGTYRHLLLEQSNQVEVEHCYLNTIERGNLSSLRWIEGPLGFHTPVDCDSTMVSVYYAALNFRDVMTASGKINVDSITRNRRQQQCIQGLEFSGRTPDGKRVMGMFSAGACASLIKADKFLLWNVPDGWSLADAATVPVVYATCIYAFFMKGRMQRGNTVLIHSGAGGIGQAAITLALDIGCTVYTTVGTSEKRKFLKKKFPQLRDVNIANSRDISFENHIMTVTNGKGVDIVLNSLAEEKLLASVRCLARGGQFLEIGKFDLANDNTLNLMLMEKEASFHGVMLDAFFHDRLIKPMLRKQLQDKLDGGIIKPLEKTTFNMNQAEEALRYMSTGKHMGKVLLQVRQEEKEIIIRPNRQIYPAIPRYYCDNQKTYIICGGLGGFGLELADWLVLRGCEKLVLTSRSGIKTGYQEYRISIWKSYGCTVQVSTEDITTKQGCERLIYEANLLGPVHAIFNLAVVLKDSLLENQSEESFKISFQPKAYASQYLDLVSRQHCPYLRDFVIFSSVSCGRGNAGQTNYGMSNSVMERLCEKRRSEGLPALAIEWGAIGDVGLVAELQDEDIEIEIGGTLQQRITNCLQCMDIFLRQNEAAIVSSIVVAEKRAGQADNIVDAVANILGIKDLKSIPIHATLAEVGMDSMTAVEIKQTLEREFDLFLTAPDIKNMTFAKLIDIEAQKDSTSELGYQKEGPPIGMNMVYQKMADASIVNIPVLPIKGKISDKPSLPTLILFPGIEGAVTSLEPFYKHIEADLVGLQYPNVTQKDTIEDMVSTYLPSIEQRISRSEPFNIVCYSFGGIIALEAAHQLEQKGYRGSIICIDSSPDYLKSLTQTLEVKSDDKLQVSLLVALISCQVTGDVVSQHLEALLKCDNFKARIKIAQNIVGPDSSHTPEHMEACAISFYERIKALIKWIPEFKLKSRVILFKPTIASADLPGEDYGLSNLCEEPVEVKVFNGNHTTILENPEIPGAIQKFLNL